MRLGDDTSPRPPFDEAGLEEEGRARLLDQVKASLAQHGLATCASGDPALAELTFRATSADAHTDDLAVEVLVRDTVTHKEVRRLVHLERTPPDARPLALAVAGDELLRATWAEIALVRAPSPPDAAPPEVTSLVQASLAAGSPPLTIDASDQHVTPPRRFTLGGSLVGEGSSGGIAYAGVDARAAFLLVERLEATAALGLRLGASSNAPDGSASTTAYLGTVGLSAPLTAVDAPFALAIPLRASLVDVAFHATPPPPARGNDGQAWGLVFESGLTFSARFTSRLRVGVETTVGAVARPVEGTDGGATFTALRGLQIGCALGVMTTL